ncbi:hypothetical protein B0T14DRAFT_224840 [Immersiella caudata]|uniref:Fungal N-terminal domain-containing protein n=1 Tax=Immersiella caudata TaxID=314043 RepID=A0AA39WRB7_9PEZI|nr:hypothetical protein B0T14DRAFT_224840 [Immersiella caudata]
MAEIVGLISAIAAITAAAFKITKAISTVRDDLGVATSSVKSILDDTKAVSFILRQIQSRITVAGHVDSDTKRMLEEILPRCKADIDEIERSLLPLIGCSGQPMTSRQRLRCLFAESKICSQQAALASLKLTLSMFIGTLQLSDGFTVEQLKEEILEAITKTGETKASFLNAEKIDQAAAQAYNPEETADDQSFDGATPATAESSQSTLASDGDSSETSLALTDGGKPGRTNEHRGPAEMQLNILKQTDFEMAYRLSDDSYLWIAAHLTLQRSVTAFARLAIEHQPVEAFDQPTEAAQQPTEAAQQPTEAVLQTTEASGQPSTSDNTLKGTVEVQRDEGSVENDHISTADEEPNEDRHVRSPTSPSRGRPGETAPRGERRRDHPPTHSTASGKEQRRRFQPSVRDESPSSSDYERADSPLGYQPQQRQPGRPQHPTFSGNSRGFEPSSFNGYGPDYGDPGFGQNHPPEQGSRPGFYGGFPPAMSAPPGQGYYYSPYHAPQGYFPPYGAAPAPPAAALEEAKPDPEKEQMRLQLEAIKRAQARREAEEQQRERDMMVRRDAEETFHRRMEEMRRAQEEAKEQIEKARIQTENMAREKLEAEIKAREERRIAAEQERSRIEAEARRKLELELAAEKEGRERQDREIRMRAMEIEEQLKARETKKRSLRASLLGRGNSSK